MAPETRSATKRKREEGDKERDEKGEDDKNKKKNAPPPLQFPRPLPKDLYVEVAKHVHESEALAFAMTSRGCRDAMKEAMKERKGNTEPPAKWLMTRTKHYGWWKRYSRTLLSCDGVPVSEDWVKWAFSMKWEYADESKYNEQEKGKLLTYLAGRGGFKDVLVWLKSEGCVLGRDACGGAAQGGHVDVLKYLESEGVAFDGTTCYGAAVGGHIKVLEYLKSERVSFDCETSWYAALGGHIHVLKYLKSEGVKFYPGVCHDAAFGGHVEVLQYLKSEGVEFDSWTCSGATEGGCLKVLKWLRSEEVNCPWDIQECLREAKDNNREEVVAWIESFL